MCPPGVGCARVRPPRVDHEVVRAPHPGGSTSRDRASRSVFRMFAETEINLVNGAAAIALGFGLLVLVAWVDRRYLQRYEEVQSAEEEKRNRAEKPLLDEAVTEESEIPSGVVAAVSSPTAEAITWKGEGKTKVESLETMLPARHKTAKRPSSAASAPTPTSDTATTGGQAGAKAPAAAERALRESANPSPVAEAPGVAALDAVAPEGEPKAPHERRPKKVTPAPPTAPDGNDDSPMARAASTTREDSAGTDAAVEIAWDELPTQTRATTTAPAAKTPAAKPTKPSLPVDPAEPGGKPKRESQAKSARPPAKAARSAPPENLPTAKDPALPGASTLDRRSPDPFPEPVPGPAPVPAEGDARSRTVLPKGAEAALASILEVVPDPRNTIALTRDPTAEVRLTKADRARAITSSGRPSGDYEPPTPDDSEWDTPSEPAASDRLVTTPDPARQP